MAFVITRRRKPQRIEGLYTEAQLMVYARFLEVRIRRLYRLLGIDREPASGFTTPDLNGDYPTPPVEKGAE